MRNHRVSISDEAVLEFLTCKPAWYYNVHVHFLQENGKLYVWPSTEGGLDLCNKVVSEKTQQIFGPSLLAEYMTAFSGRIEAQEVRCDGQHTDRPNYCNPPKG